MKGWWLSWLPLLLLLIVHVTVDRGPAWRQATPLDVFLVKGIALSICIGLGCTVTGVLVELVRRFAEGEGEDE